MLGKETQLRSKRALIEKFINEYMPKISADKDVANEFKNYWDEEKSTEINALCEAERMDLTAVYKMIEEYHFSGKEPLRESVFESMKKKPKVMERKKIFERVVKKLLGLIHKFDDDLGNI